MALATMKPLLLILSLLVTGIAFAADPVIDAKDVKNYIGKTVEVRGKCVEVVDRRGNVYLNIDGRYPKQPLCGYISERNVYSVDRDVTLQGLEGKRVAITGEVYLYKGKAQIAIVDSKQVKELSE